MSTIWKYVLFEGINQLELPENSYPISVVNQNGNLIMYCFVEPDFEDSNMCTFEVVGTGYPVISNPNNSNFIGTVLFEGGQLVYHVFQKIRNDV